MDFGLSLINCSKTAPFLTTQWVPDHEGSTVGVGEGQSNNSFTYNNKELSPDFGLGFFYLNKAHNIHYVIFFIFKKRLDNYDTLVYTYSVVNREVIRNVVDIL